MDWARLGRGYSKLHIGHHTDLSSSYFSGFGAFCPWVGLYLNLVITFPREMDLVFPGIQILENLGSSQPGLRPIGFAIGSSVNLCCVRPALSQPCVHLHIGLAEILEKTQKPITQPKGRIYT